MSHPNDLNHWGLRLFAALCLTTQACGLHAQESAVAAEKIRNQISLSAQAQAQAQQDVLYISLSTTREAADAQGVQTQLKQALEEALTLAKGQAKTPAMEVKTGPFALYPRYGRDGKINGWQGHAEMVLEGQDFARITATVGKIQSMAVSRVQYGLSRGSQAQLEAQAQTQAIELFKTKAQTITQAFGFANYSLREIQINTQEPPAYGPVPRMMAMAKGGAEADSALPVEAGKSAVTVVVSGSILLGR